jgi:hypothetical protein
MTMQQEMADFLLSAPGRTLLALSDELRGSRSETLSALMRLRRTSLPEQAAAAWEMSDLRHRGAAKFGPLSVQMYFIREALEQASSARASAYHAERLVDSGVSTVADLCGGIGGDALAMARLGLQVTLYELDPVRALFARENAAVHGLSDRVGVVEADVTMAQIKADAAWYDPARRQEHRRVSDPDDYLPPLSFLHALTAQSVANIGVKLSPAIDHALAARYGAELEFVSDGGECKEALLWLGRLRRGQMLSVTKLTDDGTISLTGVPDEADAAEMADQGRFLYEPDPAVIRAHLVQTLAASLAATSIHPQIAYLVGDELIETPWAAAYEIVERFPYSRRRLQEALSAHGVGGVVIKKRGFPQEPDEVRKQLKLKGSREMTVVLTRSRDAHQVILCDPMRTYTP